MTTDPSPLRQALERFSTGPEFADTVSKAISHLNMTPVTRALVVGEAAAAVRYMVCDTLRALLAGERRAQEPFKSLADVAFAGKRHPISHGHDWCGIVSPDGQHMCIRVLDHVGDCGWVTPFSRPAAPAPSEQE